MSKLSKIKLETTIYSDLISMVLKLENYFGSNYEKYKAKIIKIEKDKLMKMMGGQK